MPGVKAGHCLSSRSSQNYDGTQTNEVLGLQVHWLHQIQLQEAVNASKGNHDFPFQWGDQGYIFCILSRIQQLYFLRVYKFLLFYFLSSFFFFFFFLTAYSSLLQERRAAWHQLGQVSPVNLQISLCSPSLHSWERWHAHNPSPWSVLLFLSILLKTSACTEILRWVFKDWEKSIFLRCQHANKPHSLVPAPVSLDWLSSLPVVAAGSRTWVRLHKQWLHEKGKQESDRCALPESPRQKN